MKKLLFIISLGFLFTACFPTQNQNLGFENQKSIMTANKWLLQDESGTVVSYNGEAISMSFTMEDGLKANGFSGCNRYFSTVSLLAESIHFQNTGSTMMACPDMDGEEMFLDLLKQVNTYEVNNHELKLYQNKILLLRFKKQ